MYEELVKQLRYCATHECEGEGEKLVGCTAPYNEEYEGITTCNDVLQMQAADAIEELSAHYCPHAIRNVHDRGDDSLCEKYKCEVTALPRWIPVTERLPEKRKWVLCRCEANIIEVLRWENDEWYHDPMHVYYPSFVTHWMPLPPAPEPPKEEV